jgi:hypothetical protein
MMTYAAAEIAVYIRDIVVLQCIYSIQSDL